MSLPLSFEGGLQTLMPLAEGGMGRVDLAVSRSGAFERLYAVKRLHPHLRADADFREMFLQEAKLAGLLRHPNVASVLDVGSDEQGPFLVMEYVEGSSLSKIVGHAASEAELLDIDLVLEIGAQVAEGLHAAHVLRDHSGQPMQLVHRDVSPQNVLVGFDGMARVVDFGIAKALGASSDTVTAMLKGKLGYMAPEQLRFEPPSVQSDLFSLGVLLFELFTTRRLYGKGGAESAKAILETPPPDLGEERADAPDELVALLYELLAKAPNQRPTTAFDVAARLRACMGRPAEVASFMDERFGAHRRRHQAEIERRLAAAIPLPDGADADPPAALERSPASQRRAGLWMGFALAGVVGVAILVGAWWSPGGAAALRSELSPATVSWQLESVPTGAEVVVGEQRLGRTPVSLAWLPEAEPLSVFLKKEGFATERAELSGREGGKIQLRLAARSPEPPGSPPSPTAAQPVQVRRPGTKPKPAKPPRPSFERWP